MKCHSRAIYTGQRNLRYKYYLRNEVGANCICLYNETLLNKTVNQKPEKNSLKRVSVRRSPRTLHAGLGAEGKEMEIMSCKSRSLVLVLRLLHVAQGRPHRTQLPRIGGGTAQLCSAASAFLDGCEWPPLEPKESRTISCFAQKLKALLEPLK